MRRSTAISMALMLMLSACSSTPDTAAGDRSRLGGSNRDNLSGNGKKAKKIQEKAERIAEKAEAGQKGLDPGAGDKGAGKPPSSATTSQINPAFARRTATVDDPKDDATKEGITPAYAEIVKASIVGLGEDFRMTLTLDGAPPDRMPNDKTHMIVAFGITGTEEGWTAYAGGSDDGKGEFPGTFIINGNAIEMTVPWDYIQGPRAFEWYSASNWFSQLANQTHYRVDLAPSDGLAKFPQ